MGNPLRYILSTQPTTEFVGYSIPHPADNLLHLRLQTTGEPAQDAFVKGCQLLSDICDSLDDKWTDACEEADRLAAKAARRRE